jgi:hypothetical protein
MQIELNAKRYSQMYRLERKWHLQQSMLILGTNKVKAA